MMSASRILRFPLVLAWVCGVAVAADCLDPAAYEKLRQRYADLSARFDLASLSQQFVDLIGQARELKDQLETCRKQVADPNPPACDALAQQYAAKEAERQAVQDRLSAAIDMDEYLATLKWRLERSPCAK